MSLVNLKKKYIGSSVDSHRDNLTHILESVDPYVRQQGKQLFQHFILETIRGNNVIKSFLCGVLASGVELPLFSSPVLLPTSQLVGLITEFVRSHDRNEVQEIIQQWTCQHDLGRALAGVTINSENVEEMLAILFYLCQVLVQGRQNRDSSVLWNLIDSCQKTLFSVLYPTEMADLSNNVKREDN